MIRVFLWYVRKDRDLAQRLADELKGHGVHVWSDVSHLFPGNRWEDQTREALSNADFFITCFSNDALQETYIDQYLTLVVAEAHFRRRVTSRPWIIPVLLSPCELPSRLLNGKGLSDFPAIRLYDDWEAGVGKLLSTIDQFYIASLLEEGRKKPQSKWETASWLWWAGLTTLGALLAVAIVVMKASSPPMHSSPPMNLPPPPILDHTPTPSLLESQLSVNGWVEARNADGMMPLPSMTPSTTYNIAIDISLLAHNAILAGIRSHKISRSFQEELRLYASRQEEMRVYVRPILSGRGVSFLPTGLASQLWRNGKWEKSVSDGMLPLDIDVTTLKNIVAGRIERMPGESSTSLAERLRMGGVKFAVKADEPGCASVAVSIWNEDLSRSLGVYEFPVSVGDVSCGGYESLALSRNFLALIADEVDQKTDAVLDVYHFYGRSVGLYIPNRQERQREGCDYFEWTTPRPLLPAFSNQLFQDKLKSARGSGAYDVLADYLYRALFPVDDEKKCGGAAAARSLMRLTQSKGRVIFARITDEKYENVMLPLGLLFLALDDNDQRIFQYAPQVVQPLFLETYSSEDACLGAPIVTVPKELLLNGTKIQLDVGEDLLKSMTVRAITDIDEFKAFMSGEPGLVEEDKASLLLLLAHHAEGEIFFDDRSKVWDFSRARRNFKPGSAVILDVCSAGDLTLRRYELVRALNSRYIDAMILSPYDVPGDFGIDFAEYIIATIGIAQNQGRTPTLAEIFDSARELAANESSTSEGLANEFILAGNGGIKLCPQEVSRE